MRTRSGVVAVVLAAMLVPWQSWAGQLFVESFGIAKVLDEPGVALLGSVAAVDNAKGTVSLLVKQVWVKKGGKPQLQVGTLVKEPDGSEVTRIDTITLEVGKTYQLPIYRGVVWKDERESPIDRRVHGHLEFADLKPKQEVVYLGQEVVAATTAEQRKLDLFFGGQIPAEYPAKARSGQLREDLADFDLGELALAELVKRKEPVAEPLALIAKGPVGHALLYTHWHSLDPQRRAAFLAEAQTALSERANPEAALCLIKVVLNDDQPAKLVLPGLARLVGLLDSKTQAREQREISKEIAAAYGEATMPPSLEVLRLSLQGHLEAKPGKDADAEFLAFVDGLRPADRLALLKDMLAQVSAAAGSGKLGPVELRELELAGSAVDKYPDAALAQPLADLALTRVEDFDQRVAAARPTLAMAVAIGRKAPKAIPVLKPAMDKLLKSEKAFMSKASAKPRPDGTVPDLVVESGVVLSIASQVNDNDYVQVFGKPR